MASRSPAVVTPLPKPSSAPDTPAIKETTTNTTPHTVPFPSPQTFDIIPPLHGLLKRLLSPQTAGEGPRAAGGATGETGPSGSGPSQGVQQPSHHPSMGNGGLPLSTKELPTEASAIKIRIQKAHAVVEGLPDIHRSVAEQEREIAELEDRISKLKSVVSDFGRRADVGVPELHRSMDDKP
ncbi:RNA polymerase II mediator complex middle subunit MED9 [Aspergillus clavatus NRRL 1]|uniref:Mediator of RNA polymerase II transcription subunit 9 n=1 Tax=Aspergillus clavatus (strain ATCC 1007 / CBS 513.65 / DSM 816 / NCTC 3887 / NRRL 1 / QM 1276 / 107) TaxID=344612 RepID=A1CK42_ASPCL|nr:uncharacterized protein ACLA_037230 [Aspergillus clavatus NRRL 1]EAW09516.1 conserved hypothetical protein [Aspergillus clavatus NRRL 1]